ncbi:MAG: hypothetical protein M3Y58_11585 [Chloroflexota bacterium]|nr:hypothetical protein [Chloroflexota bacterium]
MTSKYAGLGEYLAAIGAATIILTFAEVETIVEPLPVAAHSFVAWWPSVTERVTSRNLADARAGAT